LFQRLPEAAPLAQCSKTTTSADAPCGIPLLGRFTIDANLALSLRSPLLKRILEPFFPMLINAARDP